MKAALLKKHSFTVESMDIPKPQKGEVLVKTLACGVCGSDIGCWKRGAQLSHLQHMMGHPDPLNWEKGVVLGHEFCGEIIEFGTNEKGGFKVGERVCAVPAVLRPTSMEYLGFSNRLPGGFAQFMVLSQDKLFAVPNGLDAQSAALTEPLAVVQHAINAARVQRHDCALVVGCGPIGLMLIAALKQRGVESICVIEPVLERRQLARTFGATHVIEEGLEALLPEWIELNLEYLKGYRSGANPAHASPWLIFNCVGVVGVFERVVRAAPRAARIIQVGLSLQADEFNPFFASSKELTIQYVNGYTDSEFQSSLHLLSEGAIDLSPMPITKLPLSQINQGMQALLASSVHGKVIIEH